MPDLLTLPRCAPAALLVFFTFAATLVSGQSFQAYLKAADQALEQKDYNAAMHYLSGALEIRPDDPDLAFRYAEAARHFHAYELAAQYYLKVLESEKQNQYPQAAYGLAVVKKTLGQYDEARGYFQAYLAKAKDGPYADRARREITNCVWAKEEIGRSNDVRADRLGREVNTGYSEFAPLLRNDTLYYSSFRYGRLEDDYQPPRKISKVLYLRNNGRGRPLRHGFNDDKLHTAHNAFSLDGERLYFTRCDYVNASEIRCELYYRERGRRGRWDSRAIKLPEALNMAGYTATHPAVGYDSARQAEVLFFVSGRPGGGGGLDIWWATVEEGENAFGPPMPLETLNTPYDEITPFFDNRQQALFFSSEGYANFGGFDVFRSDLGASWAKPENLGPPINSSYHDLYYVLQPDGRSGYFSSNRPGSYYLDEDNQACCHDIYRFERLPEKEPAPGPDTSGTALSPLPVQPDLPAVRPGLPSRLEDFLPLALYFDNDEPDRRTRRTATQKTYGQTFDAYYSRKEEYLKEFAAPLSDGQKEAAESAVDEFFEEEVLRGYELLERFSEILLSRLEEEESVEIFLKGYTSPRARSDYNLALSQRRISSVRNHFQNYREGVFQDYLASGRLVISERPFGEAAASNTVIDALDDLRNSIFHPDAARERRVEIVEIKRD